MLKWMDGWRMDGWRWIDDMDGWMDGWRWIDDGWKDMEGCIEGRGG